MEDWPNQIDLIFSGHALGQMFVRKISTEDVRRAITGGQMIADYPDDTPLPSRLFFAWTDNQPLHIVLAYDRVNRKGIVVTAYRPDPEIWDADFTNRRKP